MKKLIFSIFIGASTLVYAQCNIGGANTVQVGQSTTYQVPTEYAQCENCHQWRTVGNARLEGDNRKNEIKISANQPGMAILGLTMITPNGVEQCSKNITFVEKGTPVNVANTNSNSSISESECDIDITSFKEVKYEGDAVAFFPNTKRTDYQYQWETTYVSGGQPVVSNQSVPTFQNNLENFIEKVELKVSSTKCIKRVSKKYNQSFWRFLSK